MGKIASAENRLCLALPAVTAPHDLEWYVAVCHFTKSAVLTWPVDLVPCDGGNHRYLRFKLGCSEFTIRAVTDLRNDAIRGLCYDWKSWLWQVNLFPQSVTKFMPPAVRAFVDKHGEHPIGRLGSHHAWWQEERAFLEELGPHLGIAITKCLSLFDILWLFIQG